MKRTVSLLLALAILFSLSVPAMAADDATGTTLRLEETNGTVTVKDAAGKEKSTREGMRLYNGYTIATDASSSAYISLDESKAVKLDSSGKVEIKKSGKKLEVSLTSGQLYFNVTEPLKVDESLNIRTSTMVTGIRGSFGWVNPTQMGLMHGHVTLTCTNPETEEVRVTEVYSGEMVRYEQAAAPETSAEPELLEIDFVKESIANEDVPAIVVEEIANDEALRERLEQDVPSIDVPALIESLPEKRAEEAEAEKAAREKVEAAVVEQEREIAASISEDAKSGDTAQNYADLSANTTTGGGDDSGGGDDRVSYDSGSDGDSSDYGYTPTTYYTVSMIVERASHCTVDYQNSYSVPAGGSFSFTVTREDDYSDGGYYSYYFENKGAGANIGSFGPTATSGNTTTFTASSITGDATFHFESVSAYTLDVTDSTLLSDVSAALSTYDNVELNLANATNQEWTPTDSALSVAAEQYLSIRSGTLVLDPSGAASDISIAGAMRINNGAALDMRRTDGRLSIQSGGSLTNIGAMEIASLTVMSNASFYNAQSATATFNGASSSSGNIYNIGSATFAIASTGSLSTTGLIYNESTIINEGTITNGGTINNVNGSIDNRAGATFTNDGTILN